MLHDSSVHFTPALTAQEQVIIDSAKCILAGHLNTNPVVSSWHALLDYCAVSVRHDAVEVFHVLLLDKKNRLLADVRMATGTIDHVPVYPREVVRLAIQHNASAIILAHNHPSGDPAPSKQDIAMTKDVQAACQILGITLHDHIITGADKSLSMRATGVL